MALYPMQGARDSLLPNNVAAALSHICALCESARVTGGFLTSRPREDDNALWVCKDCQRKLARRLDDEGSLGG